MGVFDGFLKKYTSLQASLKSFFLLIILFLVFFAANLFITVKNKPQSAYTVLTSDREIMLQDTRVHNWSELKKNKNSNVKAQ